VSWLVPAMSLDTVAGMWRISLVQAASSWGWAVLFTANFYRLSKTNWIADSASPKYYTNIEAGSAKLSAWTQQHVYKYRDTCHSVVTSMFRQRMDIWGAIFVYKFHRVKRSKTVKKMWKYQNNSIFTRHAFRWTNDGEVVLFVFWKTLILRLFIYGMLAAFSVDHIM
jgi:hypothetical protein